MRNTLLVAALLAVGLSACGQKEEAAQTDAPAPMEQAADAAAAAVDSAANAASAAADAATSAVDAAASTATQAAAEAAAPAAEAVAAAGTAVAAAANSAAGAAKYSSSCASCHGVKGQGMGSFPKLAGQSADMIKSKMATYKAGKQIGPQSAVMMPIASMLSDAEVENLAAHIASL